MLELAEGFKSRIKKGGVLILSGLLEMDREAIVTGFSKIGFKEVDYLRMDEWIGIVLTLH